MSYCPEDCKHYYTCKLADCQDERNNTCYKKRGELMIGPCAKQTVVAIIENNGRYWIGSNVCLNAQTTCPRVGLPSGIGYEKCQDICLQTSHAEASACGSAGVLAEGGTLYLIGHNYCCDRCESMIKSYKIKNVVIGKYPPSWELKNPLRRRK